MDWVKTKERWHQTGRIIKSGLHLKWWRWPSDAVANVDGVDGVDAVANVDGVDGDDAVANVANVDGVDGDDEWMILQGAC